MKVTCTLAAIVFLSVACGGPSVPPQTTAGSETAPPLSLYRRHAAPQRYSRIQQAWMSDDGQGNSLRLTLHSNSEVTPRRDGAGFDVRTQFESFSLTRGEEEIEPPASMQNLEPVRVSMLVDIYNRVVSGPTSLETTETNQAFVNELSEAAAHMRVVFPEHAVHVGDAWDGESTRWDTRPFGIVVLRLTPHYRFVGREGDGLVRIEHESEIEIPNFRFLSHRVRATGEASGYSLIGESDGVARETELEIEVYLRPDSPDAPAGAEAPTVMTVRARYREDVEVTR